MIRITFPPQKPAVKTTDGREVIFCIIRKRWLLITPEEWVRQNFLLYLIHVLKYPASLIAVERQLLLSDIKKRFDIVVYRDAVPFLIVECKEMNVQLSESTLLQVLRYNTNIQAPYMAVTNGSYCVGYMREKDGFYEVEELPGFGG